MYNIYIICTKGVVECVIKKVKIPPSPTSVKLSTAPPLPRSIYLKTNKWGET